MAGNRPVVVAGAGIAGLTLALALARRGVAVRVYERAAALEEVGAGLQLAPNASRALDALGLGPALDRAAIEPVRLAILSGRSGAEIAQLPVAGARRRWGAPYRLVHRAALQQILAAAARAAGAEILLGTAITGFDLTEDGARTRFPGGGEEPAAALVGADGLFSTLRRALGDTRAPHGSDVVAWRAVLPPAARPAEIALWLGPGGHVVTYPIDGAGSLNVVACLPGAIGGIAAVPGDADDLRRLLRGWAPAVLALAEAPAEWTIWPLLDRAPGHFPGRGAVALIGDAAHPALPHLAQGAALAIEDAVILADAITAAAPGAIAAALRGFEQARGPRVARIQAEARTNGRVYALGPLPSRARDLVLAALGPERLMARYDWLYGEARPGAT